MFQLLDITRSFIDGDALYCGEANGIVDGTGKPIGSREVRVIQIQGNKVALQKRIVNHPLYSCAIRNSADTGYIDGDIGTIRARRIQATHQ